MNVVAPRASMVVALDKQLTRPGTAETLRTARQRQHRRQRQELGPARGPTIVWRRPADSVRPYSAVCPAPATR